MATINATDVIDGSENQKQINDKTIQVVNTLNDLISVVLREDGQIVRVLSYHTPMSGLINPRIGGGLFVWSGTESKSKHDGGYTIDPLITLPDFANFNTYYNATNTGNGCWVRIDSTSEIDAENYGLSQDSTFVWSCAAVNQALYYAASFNLPRTVKIGTGTFRTTNPIIISKIHAAQGTSVYYRVPKLIGAGRGATEFIKTTANHVGSGYLTDNIDAVIFVCPKDGDLYGMYDRVEGISVYRYGSVAGTGYGFYLRANIYGSRNDLRVVGCDKGYFQTDCWMSQVNNILTDNTVSLGIGITSGTSVTGRNLYVTNSQGVGIDLSALTYSDLSVHADGCGTGSPDGANAIQGSLTHSIRLLASVENHKGTEFYFTNSRGVVITGRSYNTADISTTVPKIKIDYESNIKFVGFDWEKTFSNRTQVEAEKYAFLSRISSPNVSFENCTFNDYFKDFPYKLSDSRLVSEYTSTGYREVDRTIYSKVIFTGTTYKKSAYVGDCGRFFIEKAICTNPAYDRYFESAVAGYKKTFVSTNASSPTPLSTAYYVDGVLNTINIWGYIDTNGWLWLRNDVTGGNNLEYQFIIRK